MKGGKEEVDVEASFEEGGVYESAEEGVKPDVTRKEEVEVEVSGQDEVKVEVTGDELEVEIGSKANDDVAADCKDEVSVAALVMPTDTGSSMT